MKLKEENKKKRVRERLITLPCFRCLKVKRIIFILPQRKREREWKKQEKVWEKYHVFIMRVSLFSLFLMMMMTLERIFWDFNFYFCNQKDMRYFNTFTLLNLILLLWFNCAGEGGGGMILNLSNKLRRDNKKNYQFSLIFY